MYSYSFTLPSGCDSIIHLNLTINNSQTYFQTLQICQGDSVVVGNSIYISSGDYLDILQAANGCDSIVNTNLSVVSTTTASQNISICNGQTYTIGNSSYAATGSYYDVFQNIMGCDSIIVTNLTVLNNTAFVQSPVVCSGGSVMVGSNIYTTSGSYIDTLTASNGCDSVVTTHLSVLPVYTTSQSYTVCQGDSVTVGGVTYYNIGVYNNIQTATNGCDSIITVYLNTFPNNINSQYFSICDGDSVLVGNSVYTAAGSYSDTLIGLNGCDSIVNTNLSVVPTTTASQNISICNGQSYTIGNSIYAATGSYYDVFQNIMGCDSIIVTNLTVLNNTAFVQSPVICSGGSVIVGSNVYTTSGSYIDTLTASNGCDSVVTTHLSVLPVYTTSQSYTICQGDSVTVGGVTYYNIGVYNNIQTATNGCDSIITVYLNTFPNNINSQYFSICEGDSVLAGNSVYTAAGSYSDTLMGLNGCDSIVNTNIGIASIPVVTISQNGSSLVAFPNSLTSYQWSNGDTTNSIIPDSNGTYWVIATNNYDCESDTVYFEVDFVHTSIKEFNINKTLLIVTDVLGRKTKPTRNTPLFYRYDDGTVEKRIIIE